MQNTRQLIDLVDEIRELIEDAATYDKNHNEEGYKAIRIQLLSEKRIQPYLPTSIKSCSTLGIIRSTAQGISDTYKGRRRYIDQDFDPLKVFLEQELLSPLSSDATDLLINLNSDKVAAACQKAIDRVAEDPDGAITAARTLLEAVCKYILAEKSEMMTGKEDLPALFRKVISSMNLAPDQLAEPAMRQIMQGCSSVVQGVGELRSKIGDAHGHAPSAALAERRHAELAVNVSCAVSAFLIETYEEQLYDPFANEF